MTDINLNPQLTARLRAVQQFWGHDNIGETVGTILDAIINKWDVPIPNTPHILVDKLVDKSSRVRLKARHAAYFEQMSQLSGLAITELARTVLIQWLCIPRNTLLLPENNTASPKSNNISPNNGQLLANQTLNRPKNTQKQKGINTAPTTSNQGVEQPKSTVILPENNNASPQNNNASSEDTPTTTDDAPKTPKITGRTAFLGVMNKK